MKVESIAECSLWSILQYFWPALSDNWSWKSFFGLLEKGRFTKVLLYMVRKKERTLRSMRERPDKTTQNRLGLHLSSVTCADLEDFVRGGPTLTTFFFFFFWGGGFVFFFSWWEIGGSKYHYKRAMIGPAAKRHFNYVRWHAEDGPTMNAGSVAS